MPKFAASSGVAEVTMFQPARPPLTWSTDARRRARLYGSLYVDDTVAIHAATIEEAIGATTRYHEDTKTHEGHEF